MGAPTRRSPSRGSLMGTSMKRESHALEPQRWIHEASWMHGSNMTGASIEASPRPGVALPRTSETRRCASELRRCIHGHQPVHPCATMDRGMRHDPRGMQLPRGLLSLVCAPPSLVGGSIQAHGCASLPRRGTGEVQRTRDTASMSIFRKKTKPRSPSPRHHGEDDDHRAWCTGAGVLRVVNTDPEKRIHQS